MATRRGCIGGASAVGATTLLAAPPSASAAADGAAVADPVRQARDAILEIGEEGWKDLYVVVLSPWMTSVLNQNSIIIKPCMNPAKVDTRGVTSSAQTASVTTSGDTCPFQKKAAQA